jgi:hypothetical protein
MAIGLTRTGDPAFAPLMGGSEVYPAILRAFGEAAGLLQVAVILSSWITKKEGWTPEQVHAASESGYRVSEDPDREEILLLGIGDAEREVWLRAPILRSKLQVALGEWEDMGNQLGGRQPGSLRAAVGGTR